MNVCMYVGAHCVARSHGPVHGPDRTAIPTRLYRHVEGGRFQKT